MLELKSQIDVQYIRAISESRRNLYEAHYHCANGDISAVCISFRASDSVGTTSFFVASETPITNPLNDFYTLLYTGTATSMDGISGDSGSFSNVNKGTFSVWIQENAIHNNFERYYSETWGETKTHAQLFAELQNLYGDNYQYFAFGAGAINGTILPIEVGNYRWGWYDAPASTSLDMICTNSVPNNEVASTYIDSFSSLVAIDSEYVPNITDIIHAMMYFIFSPAPTPPEKLVYDVYVDGVIGGKGPSIQIKWKNNNPDTTQLAPSLITPRIWGAGLTGVQSGTPTNLIHTVDGILVPDADKTPLNASYSFDDEGYSTTYVGASDSWYADKTDLARVLLFGTDKIPDMLCFLLRFDYGGEVNTIGDLWYVYIPYEYEGSVFCEHAQIDNSSYSPQYLTEVNIIGGLPPEEPPEDPDEVEPGEDDNGDPTPIGPYDPDSEHIDFSSSEPEGFSGNAVLTRTYCMPTVTIENVGSKLWSQSYFDVLKVQSNPIENIIACKWFPFTVTGTTEEIQVGDVAFGVTAQKVSNIKVIPFTSSYKYTTTRNRPGYLSCSPYTMIKLHLPYCGVVQLDATEILERTLNGKYIIDLITGDVLVILTLDGMPYLNISGKMGVDIPLSATNRAQTELGIANKALSATLGAAAWTMSGNYMGAADTAGSGILSIMGMDYTTQRSGTHSPACSTYEDRSVWIEITRSIAYVSEGYRSGHGYPAHVYKAISKGAGFIKVDKGARITVAMTDEENRELEQIMQKGCYF